MKGYQIITKLFAPKAAGVQRNALTDNTLAHLMSPIVKARHDFAASRTSLLAISPHPSITTCNIMDELLSLLPSSTPLFSQKCLIKV